MTRQGPDRKRIRHVISATMASHWFKEFWRQAYSKRVPALPLVVLRVVMGAFWFTQMQTSDQLSLTWFTCFLAGVLLSIGLLTKLGALVGIVLTGCYVADTIAPAGDALWPYGLLMLIHLVILTTGCGRSVGIDQLIVEKLANWHGNRTTWVKLIRGML